MFPPALFAISDTPIVLREIGLSVFFVKGLAVTSTYFKLLVFAFKEKSTTEGFELIICISKIVTGSNPINEAETLYFPIGKCYDICYMIT